jgi:type VI secretion system secreted protein Hcp
MYLKVTGASHGVITGEAQADQHVGEIEVLSWSWAIQGQFDLATGNASGKASMRVLRVVKRVDKASTALMSVLRTNELIKCAVLTLRKTGKTPFDYMTITIEQGHVVSLEIEAGDISGSSIIVERVAFTFNKIAVNYTAQGPDGQPHGGASTFQDQWGSAS